MPVIVFSAPPSSNGERLARIPAAQHVDAGCSAVEVAHVGQDRDSGPVPLEDGAAVLVGLAEPFGRASDGEVEAADAGEQGADIHAAPLLPASSPKSAGSPYRSTAAANARSPSGVIRTSW
ncbi:hypothetical protein Gocc_2876 [Gaiella occulta]|uniref:Uncharacterized protein n=1 Tax=Gaiella occulta TaxID=1002870 RepID=A0A7M2YT71_9ACTN|nr:hypothetical protein Gocc_2876 [Gaiella occulta]